MGGYKKKPLSPQDKKLDKIPSSRLYAALGRRSHKKLKQQAPEIIAERVKKIAATKAIRKKYGYCTHTLTQPRVRTKGEFIGLLCCGSCGDPFDEAHVAWLRGARCQDPKRIGCTYVGRCWVLTEPERPVRCMPCPDCGGFEYQFEAKVDRSAWEVVLTGETK